MTQRPRFWKKCMEALFEKDRLDYLGYFIKGFIHNINGPLQNISMLMEILTRGLDAQDRFVRSRIEGDLSDWEDLVDKLRTRYSQVDQQVSNLAEAMRDFMVINEIERKATEIDLNLVLTKLVRVFQSDLFFKHQVALDLKLTRNLPLIHIPGSKIIPVLVHLIRNALTAMQDSPVKQLTIESSMADGNVVVSFRDSGCGLGTGEEEACFELFYSGWENRGTYQAEDKRHIGFGLFAARKMLSAYGAKVRLEGNGPGIRAVLEIPPGRRA